MDNAEIFEKLNEFILKGYTFDGPAFSQSNQEWRVFVWNKENRIVAIFEKSLEKTVTRMVEFYEVYGK